MINALITSLTTFFSCTVADLMLIALVCVCIILLIRR